MRNILGNVSTPPFLNFVKSSSNAVLPLRCSQKTLRSTKPLAQHACNYPTQATRCSRKTITGSPSSNQRQHISKHVPTTSCIKFRSNSSSNGAEYSTRSSRDDLPSQEEGRRSHVSKKFSHVMDHLQSNIFIAGQRLNDLTGYSGIEALKRDIEEQESTVQNSRSSLQKAREAYSTAISQRSSSQREVNELLQRKHAWTPNDLERFTTLYRSDHANEQAESAAQEYLVSAERQAEEAATKLSASILARYHEEQIWSDKIRRMSTWGTWGLMGVNVLLFLIFQIGVEPWRRKRLVKGFEDKVMEALEREIPMITVTATDDLLPPISPIADTGSESNQPSSTAELTPDITLPPNDSTPSTSPPNNPLSQPPSPSPLTTPKNTLLALLSTDQILIRRRDLTAIALQSAAAGIAIASLIAVMLRPR